MRLYRPNYGEYTPDAIERIRNAQPSDSVVKVLNQHLSATFKRGQWVKITCGDKSIYRIIRGAVVPDLTIDAIWLSYDSILELGMDDKNRDDIQLREASFFEQYVKAPWYTPNLVERNLFRVATVVGLLGVLLGILGLLN